METDLVIFDSVEELVSHGKDMRIAEWSFGGYMWLILYVDRGIAIALNNIQIVESSPIHSVMH